MARSLFLTRLNLISSSLVARSPSPAQQLLKLRCRSTLPENLSPSSSSFELEDLDQIERLAIHRLEDAIHRLVANRVQPDWLPLVPGASFWVPPASREEGFVEVIGKLATRPSSVHTDQAMALATNRCWPSSDYFFKGASSSTRETEPCAKHTSQSEDDEG